jgi:type IX secretion system PorP/SprF family membrane protein
MKKKVLMLVGAALMATFSTAVAQQKPQYSQYMVNNYLLNPAITGIEDYTDLRMGVRRQWVGLEGAPETMYLSFHTPINKPTKGTRRGGSSRVGGLRRRTPTASGGLSRPGNTNRFYTGFAHHGLGGLIHTDRTGPLRRTSLLASYAYHLPVTRRINVAGGLSTGLIRNSVDIPYLRMVNPSDPAIRADLNENLMDMNLGLWVYSQDFFVGMSGAQLIPARSDFRSTASPDGPGKLQKHYFLTGGYRFRVSDQFHVIPSVMAKLAQPSPVSFDVNLRAIYADRVWVGASYRHQDAIVALLGLNINPLLDVSYSYDATSSNLNRVSTGSHEIVLGFKLLNRGRVICPQFLW